MNLSTGEATSTVSIEITLKELKRLDRYFSDPGYSSNNDGEFARICRRVWANGKEKLPPLVDRIPYDKIGDASLLGRKLVRWYRSPCDESAIAFDRKVITRLSIEPNGRYVYYESSPKMFSGVEVLDGGWIEVEELR